jgi:hypothetical protein
MTQQVRRAYKYRFYPTDGQAAELARTFGCVRKVCNLALEARTVAWYQRQERVSHVQTSAMLTEWKHSEDLAFLAGVSSVPLQQALRHLQGGQRQTDPLCAALPCRKQSDTGVHIGSLRRRAKTQVALRDRLPVGLCPRLAEFTAAD